MDHKMSTISIVTPSYNQGNYLEDTIKSVLSQQGAFFIDYIIMDGGSSDNSVDIIKKYDEILKSGKWKIRCRGITMRWVSEKDRGQTHAINKGFQIATGDIISWINSDDMYCDNAFAAVVGHLTAHPDDSFAYGDGDVIDDHGNLQWEWLSRPYDLKILKSYHFPWNEFTNYIMQQATFWRRNVFDCIGLLDETLHYAMDIEYWIRAGARGLQLCHIPVKLGKFRMIQGTKSLSSATVFWPESLEIFRRFNGAASMRPFFAYYFFNEGLQENHDLGKIMEKKKSILHRWQHLPIEEQHILDIKATQGFRKACFMLATDAFINNKGVKEDHIRKNILRQYPLYFLNGSSLRFTFFRLIGRKYSTLIYTLANKIIQQYKKRRYAYRYLNK
jgi:glycosyltransferase involved in cell wall biosynthesis